MAKNKVLQQLSKALDPPPLQEDEVTVNDLAAVMEKSAEAIRYKFERMVIAGLMQRRKAKTESNQPCVAYKPADGKTWEHVIDLLNQ